MMTQTTDEERRELQALRADQLRADQLRRQALRKGKRK
jgi:hypothetical protein